MRCVGGKESLRMRQFNYFSDMIIGGGLSVFSCYLVAVLSRFLEVNVLSLLSEAWVVVAVADPEMTKGSSRANFLRIIQREKIS